MTFTHIYKKNKVVESQIDFEKTILEGILDNV